jgi:hypothetical protein
LRPRSCVIDGEAVACGEDGIASFDRIRYRRHDGGVFLYAFDLIELDGDDLRRVGDRGRRDAPKMGKRLQGRLVESPGPGLPPRRGSASHMPGRQSHTSFSGF